MSGKSPFSVAMGISVVLLLATLWLVTDHVTAVGGQDWDKHAAHSGLNSALQSSDPVTAYLPLVVLNYPPPPPVFGVEINRGMVSSTISKTQEAGIWWVRYNGILWSEVEATPGSRDWSKLAGVENELRALSAQGLTPMVIVRGTPSWAQQIPGYSCGPIKEDALDEFADFMYQVVARYSAEPYNVKYWEIWNEPDVDPRYVDASAPYGCWGDDNDAYYAGGYYADMLKQVYPAIKQADPQAQVVFGGLLLICDPDDPNPYPGTNGCKPAKFLEGALRNGGGPFFDILAYHAYPYWHPSMQGDWDLNQLHWDHRGGVLLGKLDFIRAVFQKYGVSKPIIMNEGGLMCYSWDLNNPDCSTNDFRDDQANYVVRLYTRTWANGILGSTWYTLNGPGWRQGGLLDSNQAPRPSYNTLKFMATLLNGSSYRGQLSSGALEGYAFFNRSAQREYRVYWRNDSSSTLLMLPGGTVAVYNKFGQVVPPSGGKISIGFDPVFVVVEVP